MEVPVLILTLSFVVLLLLNVPIVVSLAMSTFLTVFYIYGDLGVPSKIIAQRMATGIDSFPLLAIPFFILSGMLMGRGGIARRLIDFAQALVGHFMGGLGYVNILTCMMFGSISGSAVAAVSSIGGFMIPEMDRKGYSRDFSVALTATAATTGLLIPPSNVMIVYALVSGGVSIAAMFMAGVLPGILTGLALMLTVWIIARRRGLGGGDRLPLRQVGKAFVHSILGLLLIIIVLGGILGGIFTATEAAAIAVVYAFIVAVFIYREVKFRDLPGILLESGVTTAVVMVLIGASSAMSWLLAYEQIPQQVSAALIGVSENKYVILLIINLLLLAVGTFMDMTPAVLIFTPILLPVSKQLGMDPVHFGVMMVANLCIGLCTPPVGTCLFVGCGIGGVPIARAAKAMLPFFVAMFVALMVITYVPEVSLWLPRLFGLLGGKG